MHYYGEGVDGESVVKDLTAAARLYRLAADQGHADGQYSLGKMYFHGEGVVTDRAKAARLYRLAANQGNAAAQLSLGAMYVEA